MTQWCGNFTEYVWRLLNEKKMLTNKAFQFSERIITYEELFENVNKAGNLLKGKGIKPGDRVMLIMQDSVSLVNAFLGAIRIGAIPIVLNTMLFSKDYPYYFSDSQARLCIIDEDFLEKIDECKNQCPVINTGEFDRLTAKQPAYTEFYNCDLKTPAFWQYSSGTTGKPKAVIHTHFGPVEIYNTYATEILSISSTDKVLSTARMFFGYGLGGSLFFPIMAGAMTILFSGRINPENFIKVINSYKPTIFFSVPSFYKQLLDYEGGAYSLNTSSLRLAISAGESLPSVIYYRWFERTGVELLDGIGTTEALHIFMSNRAGEVKPGSCGKPLKGVQVKLVDESENIIPGCKLGRLLIHHPGIAVGYYNQQELNSKVFRDGWLDTGDIFRVDQEGHFWHMGRFNDMFKVKAMWVSPIEVEEVLLRHKMISDCAVVGVPNKQGLTEIVAYIVLKDGIKPEDFVANSQIHNHCEDILARYKIPTSYNFIETIPKTATGKKKRYELREKFIETSLGRNEI
ncbi:benzoate-CoA ligase family protein [Candidatus Desantisbacteria bacterium]|nr:benzoate-CoA ligase family protein [Candidatus Desantisbacteria bacterium]